MLYKGNHWAQCAGFMVASWVWLGNTNEDLGTSWALPIVLPDGANNKEQKVYVVRLTMHASWQVGKKRQKPPEVRPTIPAAQRPMPARDLIRTAEKNWPHLFTFPPIKGKWTSLMPMASPMSWLVLQTPLRLSLASAFWAARERSTGTHVPSEIETKL